jgi:SsrA-binding protein
LSEKKKQATVLAQNRRARRDYDLLETWEAGLMLTGTEVKSVRAGHVQLKDSYVEIRDGEAYLVGAHIGHYAAGSRENHEPERRRKLLLHRRELDKIVGRVQGKGLTVVPLKVFPRGSWLKVEIALAQGKKLHDKRDKEREKEMDREMRDARRSRW